MPRVISVAHARKPTKCDKCGDAIKKGDPYRHATLKTGPYSSHRKVRCAKPACGFKQADLTSSEFLSTVYGIQDELSELARAPNLTDSIGDLESQREDIAGRIRELADECQSKLDNMPEGLQQGSTGEMLQNRIDECGSWADELEGVDISFDGDSPEDMTKEDDESPEQFEERKESAETEYEDRIDEIISELQNCSYNGE